MTPSPPQRVHDLIGSPGTRTCVVGERSLWARPMAAVLLSLGLAMGAPAQAGEQHRAGGTYDVAAKIEAIAQATSHTIEARPVRARIEPGAIAKSIGVGLNEEGVLDRDRLFSAWKAAGLEEGYAIDLLGVAWTSGKFVNGSLAENNVERAILIDEEFEAMGGDILLAVPGEDAGWERAEQVWDAMVAEENFEFQGVGASVKDADKALIQAVNTAGLSGLRLPLSALADPDRTIAYAKAIESLNSDLEKVSGWKGQTLGLAGRVQFEIGMNDELRYEEAYGVAGLDTSNGGIMVVGIFSTFVHEWGHAAKFSVESSYTADGQDGASMPQNPSMTLLTKNLLASAPEWLRKMDEHREREYLLSGEEVVSRSLEMQFELFRHELGIETITIAMNTQDKISYPDMEQARIQAPQWQSWFAKSSSLELTTPIGMLDTQFAGPDQYTKPEQGLTADKLEKWRSGKKPTTQVSGMAP